MARLFFGIFRVIAVIVLAGLTSWACMAFHFRLPAAGWIKIIATCVLAIFASWVALSQFRANWWQALTGYAFVFTGVLVWWSSITPPTDGNWAPDVARQTTGTIDGDILTLSDVRGFQWSSGADYTAVWAPQNYDLSQLQTLDVFLSYWGVPQMAHFILSFGFEDGRYLAWSIEVRRKQDGAYSPVADTFKEDTLVFIAAQETDVVGVRSVFRGEDVQLFRLDAGPDAARALLEKYVEDANALAAKPAWYNSITTNCTTVVFRMSEALGRHQDFDWRMIVNGYLPEYAYERGSVYTGISLDDLRQVASIGERARSHGLGTGFSEAIRVGVPAPLQSAAH
ncbi:MAG: DUF4105 domain-containing protein [Pseudomonadota bacterium]